MSNSLDPDQVRQLAGPNLGEDYRVHKRVKMLKTISSAIYRHKIYEPDT